ncbi:MAG: methyltransferase [Frankiales bacterium]|nr:methyltransferase [Frankiales bacterium]
MNVRALSFGAAAAAYERYRLGYPEEVVDHVLTYARRPVITALEIGAGTGKATRVFALRGITVTATEPDAAMLAELRRHVPASVTAVQSALEDLPVHRTYDCVYAAASLHWTEPHGRWDRFAALLEPGGIFASFGGPAQLADEAVQHAERAAREPFMQTEDPGSPDGTPPDQYMQWPGTELERSEWFYDVEQHVIVRRLTVSAADYVGQLSTVSAYLLLTARERDLVLARILTSLPDEVVINADIILHCARRRKEPDG